MSVKQINCQKITILTETCFGGQDEPYKISMYVKLPSDGDKVPDKFIFNSCLQRKQKYCYVSEKKREVWKYPFLNLYAKFH